MLELQDIFNCFGDAFLKINAVCYEGIKAIKAITSCRTAALGGHVDVCEGCGELHISYNSCRNRNCSKCGNVKKEQWIEERKTDLLPVRHFVFLHCTYLVCQVSASFCQLRNGHIRVGHIRVICSRTPHIAKR